MYHGFTFTADFNQGSYGTFLYLRCSYEISFLHLFRNIKKFILKTTLIKEPPLRAMKQCLYLLISIYTINILNLDPF